MISQRILDLAAARARTSRRLRGAAYEDGLRDWRWGAGDLDLTAQAGHRWYDKGYRVVA